MRSSEVFVFGRFRLETDANRLLRDGAIVLTGKAVDTLAALIRHRDRVLEKDELMKLVWPDAFVSDDSLTQNISMLRKALGDDSSQPQIIATIPRRGYRFIGTLEEPAEPAPVGAAAAQEVLPQTPAAAVEIVKPAWRPLLWAAGIAAVLLLVLIRTMDAPNAVLARRAIRFDQTAPAGTTLTSGGVLSPDGRTWPSSPATATTARPACGCARSSPRAPACWPAPRVRSAPSGRRMDSR